MCKCFNDKGKKYFLVCVLPIFFLTKINSRKFKICNVQLVPLWFNWSWTQEIFALRVNLISILPMMICNTLWISLEILMYWIIVLNNNMPIIVCTWFRVIKKTFCAIITSSIQSIIKVSISAFLDSSHLYFQQEVNRV